MSISSLSLCLIFLTFLTTPLVLSSRTPKIAVAASPATEKNLQKTHVHPPALPVSDSSSSMAKIDAEPAPNTAIAGFFRHIIPFQGWPFHKYVPFPMDKPANPSVTTTPATGAEEDESQKVPSSPSNGNRDGGNA
ncbi:hypothetical protein Bca4012_087511 [Brassica carinata]|uniref:Uncharacterized protein n=1 Tax=Brassica oleracea var. oleracea TaxID=109376 RepID=A0A0D3A4M2_BRAOL|nr:PREDICTED: uncharacterized protein LOC106308296 [Brassica oleracea var. oleracea]